MAGFPSVPAAFAPYAALAIGMVAAEIYILLALLPKSREAPTYSKLVLGFSALLGSAGLLLALVDSLLDPTAYLSSIWVLAALNFMMFVPAGLWVIAVIVYHDRRISPTRWPWPLLLAATVTGSELLMGLLFTVAAGPADLGVSSLAAALLSPWLYWSMAATMGVLLWWVPLSNFQRFPLLGLTASSAIAPFVTVAPFAAGVATAAAMATTFILLFERLTVNPTVDPRELAFSLTLAAAFCAMAAGELVLYRWPGTLLGELGFGLPMVGVMGVEFAWLARQGLWSPAPRAPTPWTQHRRWVFLFLFAGLLGEWLMAAALALTVYGPAFFPAPTVQSTTLAAVAASLIAGLQAIGRVTGSPFFLGIMGAEMGALVVSRLSRTRLREQRVRLELALGAFVVYTISGPLLVPNWAGVPGSWANVGALGPVAPLNVVPLLASYAIFAGVVLLFGRRAYCSVTCPSAVMFGGGFPQQLIPTIRESPTARRNVLGNRWRLGPKTFVVSSWALMGVVVGWSAVTSYTGRWTSPFGVDPAVLYSLAVWNIIWYGFFVAIPYVGMSPCRTWGFCTTGTFYGALGYLGFFRKEALDPEICRGCRTRDCGKACEVGLVDMPAALAAKGRYRSVKCVGSQDCDAACPYGNLVSRDVRDSVRAVLGLPDRFAIQRERLPDRTRAVLAAPPVSSRGPA